jgi:hypothetical protein
MEFLMNGAFLKENATVKVDRNTRSDRKVTHNVKQLLVLIVAGYREDTRH